MIRLMTSIMAAFLFLLSSVSAQARSLELINHLSVDSIHHHSSHKHADQKHHSHSKKEQRHHADHHAAEIVSSATHPAVFSDSKFSPKTDLPVISEELFSLVSESPLRSFSPSIFRPPIA